MTIARGSITAYTLTALSLTLQVETPPPLPPTALEQALIEHVCRASRVTAPPETDAYQECLSGQLLSLRADFGRDLSRLSLPERRAIDSRCNPILSMEGRDAYLACLSAQLTSLRNRRNRARSAPSENPPLPAPSTTITAPSGPPISVPRSATRRSSLWWMGAAALGVLVAVSGAIAAAKLRRSPVTCRVCGTDMREPGDLCQQCRHEAADALRRAAAERTEQLLAQQEEQRRQRMQEEEQRREQARLEEEARARREEHEREEHEREEHEREERRREERRRDEHEGEEREREGRQREQRSEVFDPYAVLGVTEDATRDQIDAAYREAKAKYDPAQVVGMGYEMQEHYKTKAEAVERAYQMLKE